MDWPAGVARTREAYHHYCKGSLTVEDIRRAGVARTRAAYHHYCRGSLTVEDIRRAGVTVGNIVPMADGIARQV